jgi:hypothetical protein
MKSNNQSLTNVSKKKMNWLSWVVVSLKLEN